MTDSKPHPFEPRLLALLDGELSEHDAEATRAHLDQCESCREVHAELLAVREMLAAGASASDPRPVWPHVRQRLAARPRWTPSFAFGAVAAGVAGVLVGLTLGSLEPTPAADDGGGEDLWSGMGTSLGPGAGLYGVYFAEFEEAPR